VRLFHRLPLLVSFGATRGIGLCGINQYQRFNLLGGKWALRRARDAGKPVAKISGHPLARGKAGAVSLLSDLDHPKTSWMPMFEGPPAEPT